MTIGNRERAQRIGDEVALIDEFGGPYWEGAGRST